MTDHLPPLSDEDLSAALDGEATPDVVARIAADPAARARSAALAGARDAVAAEPPPLDPDEVDEIVAAALAGARSPGATDPAGPVSTDDGVAPLRAPTRRRPPAWLAAAAIVAILGIGLALIWSGRPDHGRATKTAAVLDRAGSAAAERADRGAPAATSVPNAKGAPATTTSPAVAGGTRTRANLGSYRSVDAFRAAFATSFPSPRAADTANTSATSVGELDRCAVQVEQVLGVPGPPLHEGAATIAGRSVLVYELATPATAKRPATTTVAAVGAEACDPVSIFER
jgi:hypothetical protein